MMGTYHGWAWTGNRFYVQGTGSRLCYLDFLGWGAADLLGCYGGSASYKVEGVVYDVTTSPVIQIGHVTIHDFTYSNDPLGHNVGGYYSTSCLVSLQAGHYYVAQLLATGDVSQYSTPAPFISLVDSDDSTRYTRWDTIGIRWQ